MMNSRAAGPIVLVVEDVEETRDLLEALLRTDGYRVDPARNEEDAVTRARHKRPDLVLVSLGGSAFDVIEAALRIRQRAELSEDIAVVIFSVQTIAEGAEVEVEKNVFVTRPDNFDQLRHFLTRLLASHLPL